MKTLAQLRRRLTALMTLAAGEEVTQRSLAARLEISLGLANALLRELERDGLIAVERSASLRRSRYDLTKAGRSALAGWAIECSVESAALLAGVRAQMQRRLAGLAAKGRRRVLLCGEGPLADLAASAVLNAGMKLAGVVSQDTSDDRVAGARVRSVAEAKRIKCDLAVGVIPRDAGPLRKCLGRGVPVITLLPRVGERRANRGA